MENKQGRENNMAKMRRMQEQAVKRIALAVALMCISLCACATARKAVCPAAHVVRVAETEHSYLVTLEAGCRTEIVEVPK